MSTSAQRLLPPSPPRQAEATPPLPQPWLGRAQDIFREAFNHCFDQHGDQEHAVRVAWGAVKRRYEEMPDANCVASPHQGGGERVAPGTPTQRRAS